MTILSDIVYREMCAVAWTNKLSIIWTVLIYSIFIFKVKIVQLSITKNERKKSLYIYIYYYMYDEIRVALFRNVIVPKPDIHLDIILIEKIDLQTLMRPF